MLALFWAATLAGCGQASNDAAEVALSAIEERGTFVGDAACASCHADIAATYGQTNKARSVSYFDPETAPEQFGTQKAVYNEATNLYYEAFVRDGALYQREYRLGTEGETIHEQLHRADYVIGSGKATRSYLMDVNGYLTEMPLTWYAERERWDMSPGYEEANDRFGRKISLECMTCHNSTPQHTPFTQNHYTNVPLGIGCEGCHGPGSRHVEARQTDAAPEAGPDATIINPASLDRRAQLSVCQQCHLAGITVFEPGEDPTTFRPGAYLATNRTVYVPEKQLTDPDWVGIDSHPLRLARSACFKGSEMTCTTCHDAHKPASLVTQADYNAACGSCHGTDAHEASCTRPEATSAAEAIAGDCVSCHMPRSGTSDVPHVTSTDHWIRPRPETRREVAEGRPSFDEAEPIELVALHRVDRLTGQPEQRADELEAATAYFRFYETMHRHPAYVRETIDLARQGGAPDGAGRSAEAEIALARALAEADSLESAAGVMRQAAEAHPQDAWVHYWHGAIEERTGNLGEAVRAFRRALAIQPQMIEARTNLAGVLYRAQRFDEALGQLQRLVKQDPVHVPEAWFNMGVIYLGRQDLARAVEAFEQAAQLNPDLAAAHVQLGAIYAGQGNLDEAVRRLRTAIIADPQDPAAYGSLGLLYLQAELPEEARRLFQKVVELDPDNENARALLQQLEQR